MWILWVVLSVVVAYLFAKIIFAIAGYLIDPTITGRLLYRKTVRNNGVDPSIVPNGFIEFDVQRILQMSRMFSNNRSAMLSIFVEHIESSASRLAWTILDYRDGTLDTSKDYERDYVNELRRFKVLPE